MNSPSTNTFLVSGTINNFQIMKWKNNFYDNANTFEFKFNCQKHKNAGYCKKSYKTPFKYDNNFNL